MKKHKKHKKHKKQNPVAKFSSRLNYNAGLHEKSNKAKRIKAKQAFLRAMRRDFDNYLMSAFYKVV